MEKIKNKEIKISVLGSGSWGGTLAWLLSKNNYKINLWVFSKEELNYIKKTNSLPRPKNIKLNKNI